MHILIDIDSATLERSGLIVGKIWVQVGAQSIPEMGWWDCPVRLTSWWSTAFLPLYRNESGAVDFDFMEGAFAIEIRRTSTKACTLTLMEQRVRGIDTTPLGTVGVSEILVSLQYAGNALIEKCCAERWWVVMPKN